MKIITNFFYFLFIILVFSSQCYTQNVNEVKILNLGNSIVHGTPKWNEAGARVGYDSYRRRLALKLDAANITYDMVGSLNTVYHSSGPFLHMYNDFDHDHEGHWGWTADEIINGKPGEGEEGKLSTWIQNYSIDFVVMRIGTNDLLWQTDTYQEILVEIAEIIAILRGKNPNVVVFLSNITPYNPPLPNSDKVVPFNGLLPDFVSEISTANSPVILVDQHTGFTVANDTYDGIHPDDSGEEKMAQIFFDAIEAYLEQTLWTGDIDTDWTKPSNWSNGVPNNNMNVFIPSGLTNYPTLTSAVECNNLTIESASGSTGSLIGQSNLPVNSSVTIERYLTADQWHIVAPPVAGQVINSFLIDAANSIAVKDFAVDSFGVTTYNEAQNNWDDYFTQNTDGEFSSGTGYLLRRQTTPGTVTFTGTLATGSVSVPVTFAAAGFGWNCVGNPYPSAIGATSSATSTTRFLLENEEILDNSYEALYVWDPAANAGSGDYVIINNAATGNGTEGAWATNYVQAGQGFIVRANADGNVSFTTDMQIHQPTQVIKSAEISWPGMVLTVDRNGEKTSTTLAFNDEMTEGLDPGYDAGVFKTGFNVYTQLLEDNGVDFGVQSLPMIGMETFEIPVGLDSRTTGEISFSFDNQNLPQGIFPVLNDKLKGEKYIFDTDAGVYTTTVNKNTSGYGRFTITFATATDTKDMQELKLKSWYSNNRITVSGNITPGTRAKLLNIQGLVLLETRLKSINQNDFDVSGFPSGIYLLQIENEGWRQIIKIPVTN